MISYKKRKKQEVLSYQVDRVDLTQFKGDYEKDNKSCE